MSAFVRRLRFVLCDVADQAGMNFEWAGGKIRSDKRRLFPGCYGYSTSRQKYFRWFGGKSCWLEFQIAAPRCPQNFPPEALDEATGCSRREARKRRCHAVL